MPYFLINEYHYIINLFKMCYLISPSFSAILVWKAIPFFSWGRGLLYTHKHLVTESGLLSTWTLRPYSHLHVFKLQHQSVLPALKLCLENHDSYIFHNKAPTLFKNPCPSFSHLIELGEATSFKNCQFMTQPGAEVIN